MLKPIVIVTYIVLRDDLRICPDSFLPRQNHYHRPGH
jgi:hypothetical protein